MCAHAGEPPSKPRRGVSRNGLMPTEGVVRAQEESVHSHVPRQKPEQESTKAAIVVSFLL